MASIAEIKQLEARIKEDASKANELSNLFKSLSHADKAVARAAMLSMRRLLLFFAEKGDLGVFRKADAEPEAKKRKTEDAIMQYRKWLWGIYVAFNKEMLAWLLRDDDNLQVAALRTLMEFVSRDGLVKKEHNSANVYSFGNETFAKVVNQLMLVPKLKGELVSVFQGEFVAAYKDVQYYMLKNLAQVLERPNVTDEMLLNALVLLEMVEMPDDSDEIKSFLVQNAESDALNPAQEDELSSSDDEDDDEDAGSTSKRGATSKQPGLFRVKPHRYAFTQCWMALLRHRLPHDSYRQILHVLPDDIMPHLVNPLVLADFLTASYEIGGVTSLLALNSLFILIQEFNFDYPDFFPKLFRLLQDPSLLCAKQRSRFFRLLDLFLSSSHLPAYLIAAFAKRLARLSLTAEPGAILFIIPMVYNLLLRHRECLQLINRSGVLNVADEAKARREELACANQVEVAAKRFATASSEIALKNGNDPFRSDEQDPLKCDALKSSLWELHAMRSHYNAEVAAKAKLFEEKLRSQFLDLEDSMDVTYKSIFEQQIKRKATGKVPLAFAPCTTLFVEEDGFGQVFGGVNACRVEEQHTEIESETQ